MFQLTLKVLCFFFSIKFIIFLIHKQYYNGKFRFTTITRKYLYAFLKRDSQ